MGVLSRSLRLLISLLHDETASMAFVSLPDTTAHLVGRAHRRLRLLPRPGTQRRIRSRSRPRHPITSNLPHVARRRLVELLMLLILSLD